MAYTHQPTLDRQLSGEERAYIAGIFDGEGCITLGAYQNEERRSWHFQFNVCVVNTDKAFLDWLAATTGFGRLNEFGAGSVKPGWKRCWSWTLRREEARWLLPALLPYLRIKRRQAEILLRFFELRGDSYRVPEAAYPELLPLCEEMSRLNYRGVKARKTGEVYEREPTPDGVCAGCGGVVNRSHYATKKFCTVKCRQQWFNVNRGHKAPTEATCAVCGEAFVATVRRKYCSPKCSKRAYRSRQQSTS